MIVVDFGTATTFNIISKEGSSSAASSPPASEGLLTAL